MLMENAPLPDLVAKFVDGVTVLYCLATGKATLTIKDAETGTRTHEEIELDVASPNKGMATVDKLLHRRRALAGGGGGGEMTRYSHHIRIAQLSIEECLWRERWSAEEEANANDDLDADDKTAGAEFNGTGNGDGYGADGKEGEGRESIFPIEKSLLVRGDMSRDMWVEIGEVS